MSKGNLENNLNFLESTEEGLVAASLEEVKSDDSELQLVTEKEQVELANMLSKEIGSENLLVLAKLGFEVSYVNHLLENDVELLKNLLSTDLNSDSELVAKLLKLQSQFLNPSIDPTPLSIKYLTNENNVYYADGTEGSIDALAGDDYVVGSLGSDNILGGDGDDYIIEGYDPYDPVNSLAQLAGDLNLFDGGNGDDKIISTNGADNLIGGAGNDLISAAGLGFDNIDAGEGDDTILSSGMNYLGIVVEATDGVNIQAGSGNDYVQTSNLSDDVVIAGGDGDDYLNIFGGLKLADGGAGNDKIHNSGNSNTTGDLYGIFGGAGNDDIIGGTGNDRLSGDAGNDDISDWAGNDEIFGGDGNDKIFAENGIDTINAGDGEDRVFVTKGHFTIDGGAGNDYIKGYNNENNTTTYYVKAGAGDDVVQITNYISGTTGSGYVYVFGEEGNDYIEVRINNYESYSQLGNISIHGDEGDDIIIFSGGKSNLYNYNNGDSGFINGGDGNDNITTGSGSDTISGGNGNDIIRSGAGADIIYSSDNNTASVDYVFAGVGNDMIHSGAGNDIIDGGTGLNLVYDIASDSYLPSEQDENEQDFVNYVRSDVGVTVNLETGFHFGGYAENDILTNIEGIFGSRFDDDLTGDEKNNFFQVLDGDNIVHAGDGNDQIAVGWPSSWQQAVDGNNKFYGEAGHDKIWGGKADDILDGGTGDDEIWGGEGYDVAYGGDGHDKISGSEEVYAGKDNDTITGTSSDDLLLGEDGQDTINHFWNFSGTSEVAELHAGNDYLNGGSGDDYITDMLGNNNVLVGGTGVDTFNFNVAGTSTAAKWHEYTFGNTTQYRELFDQYSFSVIKDFDIAEDRFVIQLTNWEQDVVTTYSISETTNLDGAGVATYITAHNSFSNYTIDILIENVAEADLMSIIRQSPDSLEFWA